MSQRRSAIWSLVAAAVLLALLVAANSRWVPGFQGIVAAGSRKLSQIAHSNNGLQGPPRQVTIDVNAAQVLRPISPLIYGLSVATPDGLAATGAHLNRWGGNPNPRYNWVHGSAWNAARDWEFRNYGGRSIAPSSTADAFVALNESSGIQTLLTVPALGWVARNAETETRSVNVPLVGGAPLSIDP